LAENAKDKIMPHEMAGVIAANIEPVCGFYRAAFKRGID
jgi:hypothetical protein